MAGCMRSALYFVLRVTGLRRVAADGWMGSRLRTCMQSRHIDNGFDQAGDTARVALTRCAAVQVSGSVLYNGKALDTFTVERTAAYVDQVGH